uniref:Periviscerokinin-2 n=4 Tax=Eumantodea TaxID=2901283 RepID=PVK2_BISPU|nr:RecName: Full=Periviscerokinin-2 [Bisanthe pulchripennis]P86647.1 RecName: Full=Periviscerokinin-2 [Chroicoptera sp. Kasungu]P86650.1 RecName: Full=Periviscerokinin-2; Short=Entsp-PVK-2 [Entella sp. Beaufort-W]P86680.1 RecName: Full=Periviscerokinin-2 [Dystacta alticeps]
GASGLISFPRV